jgi:hypothetical protein
MLGMLTSLSDITRGGVMNAMLQRVLPIALACLTTGCASVQGYPDNPTSIAKDLTALDMYFDPAQIIAYSNMPMGLAREAKRNEIIYGRMAAYDIEFAKFQQDINAERDLTDTAGDLTTLVLTALGASLASTATKTALAASATAVNGGKASIDKNVFYNKTLPALFAQMDGSRTTLRLSIEAGIAAGDVKYPLTKGLADLALYRDAGSLPGAISNISTTAGAQKDKAQSQILALRGVKS